MRMPLDIMGKLILWNWGSVLLANFFWKLTYSLRYFFYKTLFLFKKILKYHAQDLLDVKLKLQLFFMDLWQLAKRGMTASESKAICHLNKVAIFGKSSVKDVWQSSKYESKKHRYFSSFQDLGLTHSRCFIWKEISECYVIYCNLSLSFSLSFFLSFFDLIVFFHRHWRFREQAVEERKVLLFTTPTYSRALRHLFACMYLRCLACIFNHSSYKYQASAP